VTWRSTSSDASARMSRIMLIYTSPRGRMDVQYEELKAETVAAVALPAAANLPSLTGNLILAAIHAPQLPHGN
jgi:hypothetical protein